MPSSNITDQVFGPLKLVLIIFILQAGAMRDTSYSGWSGSSQCKKQVNHNGLKR